jgi:hypothetical protein
VHFVPGFAGNDFSNQSPCDRNEAERCQSVRRARRCILKIRFPDGRNPTN